MVLYCSRCRESAPLREWRMGKMLAVLYAGPGHIWHHRCGWRVAVPDSALEDGVRLPGGGTIGAMR